MFRTTLHPHLNTKQQMEKKIQSEYTMSILTELNRKADYHKSKFENSLQLMNDDFAFQVTWQLEDAVNNQHLMYIYQTTAFIIDEEGAESGLHIALDKWKDYTRKVYNVRTSSTSEMTNMVSTWKYICKLEACEYIETLIKSYQPKLKLEKR